MANELKALQSIPDNEKKSVSAFIIDVDKISDQEFVMHFMISTENDDKPNVSFVSLPAINFVITDSFFGELNQLNKFVDNNQDENLVSLVSSTGSTSFLSSMYIGDDVIKFTMHHEDDKFDVFVNSDLFSGAILELGEKIIIHMN